MVRFKIRFSVRLRIRVRVKDWVMVGMVILCFGTVQ